MKKIIALILAALLCASLTSCIMIDAGGGETSEEFLMQKPSFSLKDLFKIFD